MPVNRNLDVSIFCEQGAQFLKLVYKFRTLAKKAKAQSMFDIQKKEQADRLGARVIAKQIEPFFSGLLVLGSAFMAIMLFGAGSFLGGSVFLLPVAIAAFAYWDDGKPDPEATGKPGNKP